MSNESYAHLTGIFKPKTQIMSDGEIPQVGIFTIARWVAIFGVDDSTFRRWLVKYQVPYRKPGKTMYIDAQDLLRHMPYVTPGEDD